MSEAGPEGLEVRVAPFDNSELEVIKQRAADAAGSVAGVTDGVSYAVATNTFTVWLPSKVDGVPAAVEAAVPEIADRSAAVEVALTASDSALVYGGQTVMRGVQQQFCTSAFGLYFPGGTTGYLTAGHCNPPEVQSFMCALDNGGYNRGCSNSSSDLLGYAFGGYNDRIAFRAPGASYWVQISNGVDADMQSSAGHIYMNGYYCKYGRWGGGPFCGTVDVQNVLTAGVWMSHVTNYGCKHGDSGGPVWTVSSSLRYPSGVVTAGDIFQPTAPDGSSKCLYVALDDQVNGPGWLLL